MIRLTDTVKHLMIINVVMFIGTITIGNGQLFFVLFGEYFPLNENFKPWQIITHMFIHFNERHLLFNMLLLWMVGTTVEMVYGKWKFLFFYISCGLGATFIPMIIDFIQINSIINLLVENGFQKSEVLNVLKEGKYNIGWEPSIGNNKFTTLMTNYNKLSAGASGAIMGVLAAFGYLFPNRQVMLIIPPIPIKVKYLVIGMIGADFISAFFMGTPLLAGNNTGYVAHVGGAFTGLLIAWYWKKNQFNKHRWN